MKLHNIPNCCGLDFFSRLPNTSRRVATLLVALTHQVPVMTPDMVARLLWPGNSHAAPMARRLIRRLIARRELARYLVLAPPLPDLTRPLFSWALDEPAPDFDALSYRARSRWNAPPRTIAVLVATKLATKFYGGKPGKVDPLSIGHDLITSEVFVRQDEATRLHWVGEAVYAPERVGDDGRLLKCPDALLVKDRTVYHCVESAGAYSKEHIRSFFYDFAVSEHLSFDLW